MKVATLSLMNLQKLLVFTSLVVALALFQGCRTSPTQAQLDNMVDPAIERNFFGIVQERPASYHPRKVSSFPLRSREIVGRQNMTGDQVSLFWGLISFEDY